MTKTFDAIRKGSLHATVYFFDLTSAEIFLIDKYGIRRRNLDYTYDIKSSNDTLTLTKYQENKHAYPINRSTIHSYNQQYISICVDVNIMC